MLPGEIREALRTQPFQPFRVRLTTGQAYDVRHPEFVSLTRTSLYIGVVSTEDEIPERALQCALLHVVALEPINGAE